ncbi:MAG: GlsB/YeaQ/YmgE family stress response membrane protein [Thermoleophilia bacterium]
MDFLAYLIILCLIGLVVGGFARLALPGRDPMGIGMTIAIGIGGSLMAGFVARALFDRAAPGFLLSVIFAALIVYFVRRSRGGGLTDPGAPPLDR